MGTRVKDSTSRVGQLSGVLIAVQIATKSGVMPNQSDSVAVGFNHTIALLPALGLK
jgi:hypothetical protein